MGTSAGMGLKIKLGKIAPQLSCKFFFSGGLSQVKWQLLWAKQNKAGQKVSKLAKTERLSINLQKYELLTNDRPSQAQLISRTVFVFPLKNRSIAKFLRKLDKLRCLKLSTVSKKRSSFSSACFRREGRWAFGWLEGRRVQTHLKQLLALAWKPEMEGKTAGLKTDPRSD